MTKPIAHLLLLFAIASAAVGADPARQKSEDDIRESVFRYLFAHNGSVLQVRAKAHYLSVGGELGERGSDPSDEFMKRFANNRPRVRKASAGEAIRFKGFLDNQTGERGLLFRVRSITWISDAKVEVEGGYFEDNIGGAGYTYIVRRRRGKWAVTKQKMDWVAHLTSRPQMRPRTGRA